MNNIHTRFDPTAPDLEMRLSNPGNVSIDFKTGLLLLGLVAAGIAALYFYFQYQSIIEELNDCKTENSKDERQ